MALHPIDGRVIEKISTIPGTVPTIPMTFDHTDGTWLTTDIYEGEIFVNIADQKVYMRVDTSIIEFTTGGPVATPILSAVLAAGNTTGANDIIINVGQGIYNSTTNSSLFFGNSFFPDNVDLYAQGLLYLTGSAGAIIQAGSTAGLDLFGIDLIKLRSDIDVLISSTNGDVNVNAINGDINLTAAAQVHIKGSDTGTDKEINMATGYMEVKYTDGSDISKTQYSDTEVRTTSTDGTDISELRVAPSEVDLNVTVGTVVTEINLDNSDISITTIDSSTTTTTFVQVSSNNILSKSDDTTNSMEMVIEPGQVYIQNQAPTLLFQVNNIGVVLPEFFTPTSSADTNGVKGQLTLDDNYIYVKTSTGWKRSALAAF